LDAYSTLTHSESQSLNATARASVPFFGSVQGHDFFILTPPLHKKSGS
jgi:hypothetical protein